MLLKKALREITSVFLFFGLLCCCSNPLNGQSTLLLLQSQSISGSPSFSFQPGMYQTSVMQAPYHKLLIDKALCSRVLGKNLVFHCPKHGLIRDIHRISKHLDGYRKFQSKCGRVNYKINDDKFTIKINLNELSHRS